MIAAIRPDSNRRRPTRTAFAAQFIIIAASLIPITAPAIGSAQSASGNQELRRSFAVGLVTGEHVLGIELSNPLNERWTLLGRLEGFPSSDHTVWSAGASRYLVTDVRGGIAAYLRAGQIHCLPPHFLIGVTEPGDDGSCTDADRWHWSIAPGAAGELHLGGAWQLFADAGYWFAEGSGDPAPSHFTWAVGIRLHLAAPDWGRRPNAERR